jgi:hypothetical protein
MHQRARAGNGTTQLRILDDIPFEVDREEVFGLLHLNAKHPSASEVDSLIERANQLARPRALYQVAFVEQKETDSVVIVEASPDLEQAFGQSSSSRQRPPVPASSPPDPSAEPGRARFVSSVLRANLEPVERVFPYVATCGPEFDSFSIPADDVFGQFCWDTVKGMALHVALAHLFNHLKEAHALETLSSMNPGSGDINVWPIEQQQELFGFFGDVQQLIGVVLTDMCLMVPNKSVSGIFYSSEVGFESCQLCHRDKCPQRRAPFDPHLWEERFGAHS